MNDSTIGMSAPLGATIIDGGINFSLFSRNASGIDLLLFDSVDAPSPSRVIRLDPVRNRTYYYWHVFVPGLRTGQIYAYCVKGPNNPQTGLRFDEKNILLDPYGRGVVVPDGYSRQPGTTSNDNISTSMKSVAVDPKVYDWEGDQPLRHPSSRTIIYEMHVRGFTQHPNSAVSEDRRGTYAGLIDKIPYLQELGITAVELLPIYQFDSQDCPPGKINYWGYAPVSFFSPHAAYSSQKDPLGPVNEFRDMVKALHRAGIELILDVVYNHTAEGDQRGQTLSFRGIDNPTYYILENGGESYANYSGCGNTLNTNHPIVRRMIVDSLRYWVQEMHIDGFRFDLASILSRDPTGNPLSNPPVLWDIESDPVLSGTKLLAEAWDAAGLYQVGSFAGDAWKEWNGKYRDDIRDFFRGQPGSVRRLADRLVGSPAIYQHKQREAEQSVNFVTCHDGFTLNDLVTYNDKHNEDNGELNRDGSNDNHSWNCGIEGPDDNSEIEMLRNRQVKNFLAVTLMSIGLPMFVMGDEVRRTQLGNNNAYCQDNEISWFDWSLLQKHPDVLRFVQLLIERRLHRDTTYERNRISLQTMLESGRKFWHGVKLNEPDWGDDSHSLALQAELKSDGLVFYFLLNAHWENLVFELPHLSDGHKWKRWLDTSLASPEDIVPWGESKDFDAGTYESKAHSVVMLFSQMAPHSSES